MHVLKARAEARRFVREIGEQPERRHENHAAWFRDTFRLLDTAGRFDLGVDEVRNTVRAEVFLAAGDFAPVQAETYIDSIRRVLQADMEQAVAAIYRRWNTALEPSAGIRL